MSFIDSRYPQLNKKHITKNTIKKPIEKTTSNNVKEYFKSFCISQKDVNHQTTNQQISNTRTKKNTVTKLVIPSGYSPSQLRTAYNFPAFPASAQKRPIIAIVVAYGYHKSAAYSDLRKYCTTFGIPYPTNGGVLNNAKSLPVSLKNKPYFFEWKPTKTISTNLSWTSEMALDVQTSWGATQTNGSGFATVGPHIILVHGKSAKASDLLVAINGAILLGASVISMSFGAGLEISSFENVFYNCANLNKNIVFVASSGDYNTSNYPSTSTYVLSIGGTRLILNQNNQRTNETYWYDSSGNVILSGAGTGKMPMSLTTANTTFNNFCLAYSNGGNILTVGNISKNTPDISAVAAPSTGVAIYQNGSWYVVGGTSASAPLCSSYIVNVNQTRLNNNKLPLTQLQLTTCLYSSLASSSLYHINNTLSTPVINNTPNSYTTTNGVIYDLYNGLGSFSSSNTVLENL